MPRNDGIREGQPKLQSENRCFSCFPGANGASRVNERGCSRVHSISNRLGTGFPTCQYFPYCGKVTPSPARSARCVKPKSPRTLVSGFQANRTPATSAILTGFSIYVCIVSLPSLEIDSEQLHSYPFLLEGPSTSIPVLVLRDLDRQNLPRTAKHHRKVSQS